MKNSNLSILFNSAIFKYLLQQQHLSLLKKVLFIAFHFPIQLKHNFRNNNETVMWPGKTLQILIEIRKIIFRSYQLTFTMRLITGLSNDNCNNPLIPVITDIKFFHFNSIQSATTLNSPDLKSRMIGNINNIAWHLCVGRHCVFCWIIYYKNKKTLSTISHNPVILAGK